MLGCFWLYFKKEKGRILLHYTFANFWEKETEAASFISIEKLPSFGLSREPRAQRRLIGRLSLRDRRRHNKSSGLLIKISTDFFLLAALDERTESNCLALFTCRQWHHFLKPCVSMHLKCKSTAPLSSQAREKATRWLDSSGTSTFDFCASIHLAPDTVYPMGRVLMWFYCTLLTQPLMGNVKLLRAKCLPLKSNNMAPCQKTFFSLWAQVEDNRNRQKWRGWEVVQNNFSTLHSQKLTFHPAVKMIFDLFFLCESE